MPATRRQLKSPRLRPCFRVTSAPGLGAVLPSSNTPVTHLMPVRLAVFAIVAVCLPGCSRITGYEVASSATSASVPGVRMTVSTSPPQSATDPQNTPDDQRDRRLPTVVSGDRLHVYATLAAYSSQRPDGTETRPVVVHCEAALLKIPGRIPIRADASGGGCYSAERLESGLRARATAAEQVVIRFTVPPFDELSRDRQAVSLVVMVPAEELLPTRLGRELAQPVVLHGSAKLTERRDGVGLRMLGSIGEFLRGLYAAR